MPAWMTSELREEAPVPMPSAASSTQPSRPDSASARATASPTTPAPMTTHSTFSVMAQGSAVAAVRSTRVQAVLVLAIAADADGADQRGVEHEGVEPLGAADELADAVEPGAGVARAREGGDGFGGEAVGDEAPVDVFGEAVLLEPGEQLAGAGGTQEVAVATGGVVLGVEGLHCGSEGVEGEAVGAGRVEAGGDAVVDEEEVEAVGEREGVERGGEVEER